MRRTTTPAIPPSMYRHFAIVTVALTTGLAMFAQGENSEAAAMLAKPQAAPSAAAKPLIKSTPAKSAWGSAGSWGDSGSDFDASFGNPTEGGGGSGSGWIPPAADAAEQVGYSAEYLASLSPEEREMLLKGLSDSGMLSSDIRDNRASALEAASSRRSGAASSD